MKRLLNRNTIQFLIFAFCISLTTSLKAQEEFVEEDPDAEVDINNASYTLGNGLNFSFNKGNYQFGLTGFIQPGYFRESINGLEDINQFSSKRTFLQFDGKALKEKVSFFVQLDFSLSEPLLDAWIGYHPTEHVSVYFGQKQNFVNNREMTYREDRLQFTDRSFLSRSFSRTGREFGVFVTSKFGNKFGIAPMFSITSGDGRNSFGTDSRDTDLGGLKIGGRLDLYPLGFFKEGNDVTNIDLGREEKPKFVVGVAASRNNGVSNNVGEGHGNFILYDANGTGNYPDYTQLYADFLLKYQGFSLLAEYANATASGIDLTYTDANATQVLAPTQISEYLVLGDSFNVQLGYITKNGFSFDARYEVANQEFTSNTNSLLQDANSYTFGLSKYFIGNNLKVQTSYTQFNPNIGNKLNQFELLFQIAF